MNPNDNDIFAGLSGAKLDIDNFELGEGLVLSKTYAHLTVPMLMLFKPAPPGQHHPGPMRAAKGGWGYDIHIQLHVPLEFDTNDWFDRLNTAWWVTALLRLIGTSSLMVTVISDMPFSEIAESEIEPHLIPIEAAKNRIVIEELSEVIQKNKLDWIKLYWRNGGKHFFLLHIQNCDLEFQAL